MKSVNSHRFGILSIFLATSALLPALHAETLFYFDFDGAAGTTASTINDGSGNGLNGTATTVGGSSPVAPAYSSVSLSGSISDGLGGTIINATNDTSLRFTNAGVNDATPAYNLNSGGIVRVNDGALSATSFTFEAFVKVDTQIQFATIGAKLRATNGSTWGLLTIPTGTTSTIEPTNMDLSGRFDAQAVGQTGGPGFNQVVDTDASITAPGSILGDDWYHVALSYDDTNNTARFYRNYQLVKTYTLSTAGAGELVFTGLDLVIGAEGGGRAFDGWMDEVRFSNAVLAPTEFLYVVPEPGAASLLLGAGLGILLRRRRK